MSEDSISQVQQIAADLRAIADKFDTLADAGLPTLWLTLSVQPNDSDLIKEVDAVGLAVVGKPGETREMSGGSYHHTASGRVGTISVAAFCGSTPPALRHKEDEIRRLTAELETAKRELAGKAGGS